MDDNQSLTYSEIWYNEEKDKVVKYIKGKIEAVDSATKRLKTLVDDQQAGIPPIGGLRGEWTLYNLDVCPKRYEPTGKVDDKDKVFLVRGRQVTLADAQHYFNRKGIKDPSSLLESNGDPTGELSSPEDADVWRQYLPHALSAVSFQEHNIG